MEGRLELGNDGYVYGIDCYDTQVYTCILKLNKLLYIKKGTAFCQLKSQ